MKNSSSTILLLIVISVVNCDWLQADIDSKILRVFIFAGQSNMVGSDSKVKDIDRFPPFVGLQNPQEKILFSYNLGREEKRISNGWVALQPSITSLGQNLALREKYHKKLNRRSRLLNARRGARHWGKIGILINPTDSSSIR